MRVVCFIIGWRPLDDLMGFNKVNDAIVSLTYHKAIIKDDNFVVVSAIWKPLDQ